MAKKNNEQKEQINAVFAVIAFMVLALIFTLVSMLFQLALIAYPLVFLIMFFVSWYRYKNSKPFINNGFWLTKSERERFKQVAFTVIGAQQNKDYAQTAVQREGIHINQDGRISARSYRGKGLRNTLEGANSTLNEYLPIYRYYEELPRNRRKKIKKHYSNFRGLGIALILWVVFVFDFAVIDNRIEGGIGSNIKEYFSNIGRTGKNGLSCACSILDSSESSDTDSDSTKVNTVDMQQARQDSQNTAEKSDVEAERPGNFETEFGRMLLSGLFIILIAYFIAKLVFIIIFVIRYKKPPLVDLENVDTYNVRYEKKPRRKKSSETKIPKKKDTGISESQAASAVVTEPVLSSETEHKPQLSREQEAFNSWAAALSDKGHDITGNWENWENAGQWKNLAVVSSISGRQLRITIEYDAKSKKVYFGIAKFGDEDKVSQELLNSDTFRNIITENGLTVKNNEWWYCQRFSSLDCVFEEFCALLASVERL